MAILILLVALTSISIPLFWLASRTRVQRSMLLAVALSQLLGSLAILLIIGISVCFGELHIRDVLAQLENAGVIDHAKLDLFRGIPVGKHAIPDDLTEPFAVVEWLVVGASFLSFVSGIASLGIWWGSKTRRDKGA